MSGSTRPLFRRSYLPGATRAAREGSQTTSGRSRARVFHRAMLNGILLHGPRGTGKTFLAEAVAGEFGLKYCYVSAASLLNRFVGLTEENIRSVFVEAYTNQPVLLFIDEIDALGAKRQQVGDSDDVGGAARSFNSMTARLMECIDDARRKNGVVLILLGHKLRERFAARDWAYPEEV